MSSVAKQTVHSGNTIRLTINGKEIGRAQSVQGQRDFGQEQLYEIGSIMPQESVALRYSGSISLQKYRIRLKSLKDLGLAALGVGILNMDVIDIEIDDRFTNQPVIIYRGCSLASQTEDFAVGAISGENATWNYLSADNGTPETVNGNLIAGGNTLA